MRVVEVIYWVILTNVEDIQISKVMKTNEAPETYPMQFRDKIDEHLWKEHHILGGCCSSIEEMKYAVAREVAEKFTDAFIEKAVKFMEKIDDIDEYSWYNEEEHAAGITEECIEDFKKYMKGE